MVEEKKDYTIAHVESNGLSPTATGATNSGKILQQTIADATTSEHEFTVWEALRMYKPAVCWALLYQLCVIMEGYDTNLRSNFFAYPSFLIRYGRWVGKTAETPTGYQMTAACLKVLVEGEVLNGLPWGILATTAPAYALEVLPTCLRTYMTSFTNMCFILGQLISAGVLKGLSTRTDARGYKIPFAIQ
ncbi:hypothetical protein LTR62_003492 [Meristemomyces frigidus]|uniref:Uncharacterized protein n=1 Tax=Meristemomyces frigidus TaxID=1508187 RepID=A0AAN7TPD8_9PEZI|nr:hypothetical protein LTR62_003492 [Meristemomyces frigidus]